MNNDNVDDSITLYTALFDHNHQLPQPEEGLVDPAKHSRISNQIKSVNLRAKKRGLPHSFKLHEWRAALDYFEGCCAICGHPQGLWHVIAPDHWIPISHPNCPGTMATNIIPLCHGKNGCNNHKGSLLPDEWVKTSFSRRKAARIIERVNSYFAWTKQQKR